MRLVLRALVAAAGLCTALEAQTSSRFAAYAHCRFADDLRLVENTPLAKGVEGRTVKTVMGPKQVPLAGGVRLMYAYPETEPLANVKVEHIPADGYAQAKQDLIANFDRILTADDSSTRNYALKPRVNGLEIYGLDRKKLEGGVLGIYLFFVDSTHTATTVYFLNQDPPMRKFSSLDEYAELRDAFVETYTGCAAGHPRSAAPAAIAAGNSLAPPATSAVKTLTPEAAALPDAPLPNGASAAQEAPVTASATASKPVAAAKASPTAGKPTHKPARKGTHGASKRSSASHPGKKTAPAKVKKRKP